MEKQISIPFYSPSQHSAIIVVVNYIHEQHLELLYLTCTVDRTTAQLPDWFQLREFEFKAVVDGNKYRKLSVNNDSATMDSMLFVDLAYQAIMEQESPGFLEVYREQVIGRSL